MLLIRYVKANCKTEHKRFFGLIFAFGVFLSLFANCFETIQEHKQEREKLSGIFTDVNAPRAIEEHIKVIYVRKYNLRLIL